MSDGEPSYRWEKKAVENLNRWGEQSLSELLLATQEELGELTQAVLEADVEDGDPDLIQEELDDLAALMYQLQWAVDRRDVFKKNYGSLDELPEIGTPVRRYRPFGQELHGEVVPRDRWPHDREVRRDSFVVEYDGFGLCMHRLKRQRPIVVDGTIVVGRKHA